MRTTDLTSLPLAERLRVMEALWDSLCRDAADDLPVPEWHVRELTRRAQALDAGQETTSSWEEAKERIRQHAEKG